MTNKKLILPICLSMDQFKILFLMLLSLLLFINSTVSLNAHLQVLSSHDLAHDHDENWLGIHAMARKLMRNPKVESVADKDLVSYSSDLSGETHKREGGDRDGKREEELASTTITTSSKVSMQQESYSTHMFTMDYSPVRRRRPVHNKLLPTTTTSP